LTRSWVLPLAVVLGTLGCAEPRETVPPGVLTISQEQEASWTRNFNPLLAERLNRFPTRYGIYEPLMVFNVAAGQWVPWLATGFTFGADPRVVTFNIRPGVRWSDGRPFTARDVAFTFELLRRHRALDLYSVWERLRSVEPLGDTVRFTLDRPDVPDLHTLAFQPIVPEHVWRDVADPVSFPNPEPIATGPFTVVEIFTRQLYQLGRNPQYWQPGKPAVRSLRFPAFPGNDQANLALLGDEVDWAGNFVPAIDRIYVGRDPEHHHYWFPRVAGVIMLLPNHAHPPLDDVVLRKAMSQAIDRRQLVQVALYDYTGPADATGLSDGYARWRDPTIAADWTRYDPAAAARLLDGAGYARGPGGMRARGGVPLAFTLEVPSGWSDWLRAAEVVARGLRAVGVAVAVRAYDFNTWFDRLRKGRTELSLGWTYEGPTPATAYRGLMSRETLRPVGEIAGLNWHRFASPEADRILAQLSAITDEGQQRELSRGLQRLFAAQAPAIPLYPNPAWGSFNTRRFTGFPDEQHPFATLSPNSTSMEQLLVLTSLQPVP
jgi:peptide/nickel transport system substrate-binding protein